MFNIHEVNSDAIFTVAHDGCKTMIVEHLSKKRDMYKGVEKATFKKILSAENIDKFIKEKVDPFYRPVRLEADWDYPKEEGCMFIPLPRIRVTKNFVEYNPRVDDADVIQITGRKQSTGRK